MEHSFSCHSGVKFSGATEHLKRYSCTSGRNVSNEIRLLFDETSNISLRLKLVIRVSDFRSHFFVKGTDLCKW